MRIPWIVSFLGLALLGCTGRIHLPDGDVQRGRVAFAELGCHACHRVAGENFPDPVADPPIPFVLGSPVRQKSRHYLAESIVAPSHQFAQPPSVAVGDPPMVVETVRYENIREGSESRMGTQNDRLTVQQWLDLVAFLDAVQRGEKVQRNRQAER